MSVPPVSTATPVPEDKGAAPESLATESATSSSASTVAEAEAAALRAFPALAGCANPTGHALLIATLTDQNDGLCLARLLSPQLDVDVASDGLLAAFIAAKKKLFESTHILVLMASTEFPTNDEITEYDLIYGRRGLTPTLGCVACLARFTKASTILVPPPPLPTRGPLANAVGGKTPDVKTSAPKKAAAASWDTRPATLIPASYMLLGCPPLLARALSAMKTDSKVRALLDEKLLLRYSATSPVRPDPNLPVIRPGIVFAGDACPAGFAARWCQAFPVDMARTYLNSLFDTPVC